MTLPQPALQPTPPSLVLWTAGGFLLLGAWDFSGLDLAMAHWFGSARGFALTNHWLWRGALHDDIRWLPWLIELALLAAVFKPFGDLQQLPMPRRTQLALTTLLALLVISNIKLHSRSSCPWDLQSFGGAASYVSHWAWGIGDGGSGGCFPAGHASAGFAFLGGFFAFRHGLPRTARRWLAGALLAGFVLGFAQQVRGAHYMSHTLWTAWFCWTVAAMVDLAVSQLIARKASFLPAPVLSGLPRQAPSE
ncbi:MAG: phosphatidic acid phosphatase [Burkholderiales bacterium RIFCSPHIGHO2_12_FULL_61_11]|nr:MAG: phosphatidic acid phosphatase [Burkholderiales bacterium RIFCSPHIGHO2_12_FULL_61_11]